MAISSLMLPIFDPFLMMPMTSVGRTLRWLRGLRLGAWDAVYVRFSILPYCKFPYGFAIVSCFTAKPINELSHILNFKSGGQLVSECFFA